MAEFQGIPFSDAELKQIRSGFAPDKYNRNAPDDKENYNLNRLSGIAVRKVMRGKLAAASEVLKAEGILCTLAVVLVEGDEASVTYAQSTLKECERCGIAGTVVSLPPKSGQEALLKQLDELNADSDVHGILLMGPLPKGYDEVEAKQRISPSKDLDALSFENTARFYLKGEEPSFYPPTIAGALLALELFGVDIKNKRVAVMGRGNLVGRPIGIALMDSFNCTFTYCHTGTKDSQDIMKRAEVIVAATGRPHAYGAEDVPDNAVLLDMGVYWKDGKSVGEFTQAAYNKAYIALKTPGGSGTMTVCYLLYNCLKAAARCKDSRNAIAIFK